MLHSLRELVKDYMKIERAILYVVYAEFMIQFINAAFLAIQPIYMKHEGYTDGQSADFISYRFLGVLLLALPLGLYLKGRKIKNLFYIACIGVPVFSLFILDAIQTHNSALLYVSQFLWGASLTFIQIPVLPFILRNAKKESHTGGITLSYATWSFASIACCTLIAVCGFISKNIFNERVLLTIISFIGITGLYFVSKINIEEKVPAITKKRTDLSDFDWPLIIKALIPTLIIAVGAGLTIPFISLFFVNVHHMSTAQFSSTNVVASVLIAFGSLMVPVIKKEIGYQIAIPTTQSLAVVALVAMATTQYYSHINTAIYIAVIFFLLRQPLMNLAGPMTSEIVMNYVGKKNQEMVSGLTAAIWSGSWFVSSKVFGWLRDAEFNYVNIFLITASMYVVGIIWYYILILDYNRREKAGLLSD